jgi:hypothetical protein
MTLRSCFELPSWARTKTLLIQKGCFTGGDHRADHPDVPERARAGILASMNTYVEP